MRAAFIHWNAFYVSGFQLPLPGQGLSGERLCLGGGPWCREDSCHLLLLGPDEAVAHLIAQILGLGEGQVTLIGVGGQPSPVEFQQHLPQLLQVVLQSLRVNDDIVEVGGCIELVGPQEDLHQALEGGGGTYRQCSVGP